MKIYLDVVSPLATVNFRLFFLWQNKFKKKYHSEESPEELTPAVNCSWTTLWQQRKLRMDTFFFFKVKLRMKKSKVDCLHRESGSWKARVLKNILNCLLGRYAISFEMQPRIGKTLNQWEIKMRKRLQPIYFCHLCSSLGTWHLQSWWTALIQLAWTSSIMGIKDKRWYHSIRCKFY